MARTCFIQNVWHKEARHSYGIERRCSVDAEQYVTDTLTRWRNAIGNPHDDTDPTMSRLNIAINELAQQGEWRHARSLYEVARDVLLVLANVSRNAAMAPGPHLGTEVGSKLGEAYRATAEAHNAVVAVLESLNNYTSGS